MRTLSSLSLFLMVAVALATSPARINSGAAWARWPRKARSLALSRSGGMPSRRAQRRDDGAVHQVDAVHLIPVPHCGHSRFNIDRPVALLCWCAARRVDCRGGTR